MRAKIIMDLSWRAVSAAGNLIGVNPIASCAV